MSNSYLSPTTPPAQAPLQRLVHIVMLSALAMATALTAGHCESRLSMAQGHLEYGLALVDIVNIDQNSDSDLDSARTTAGWQGSACFADIVVVDFDHTFAAAEGAAFAIASESWFGNRVAAVGVAADAKAVAASFVDQFIAVFEFIEV